MIPLAKRIMVVPCKVNQEVNRPFSSNPEPGDRYVSTGIHEAKFPQQILLEIHRRNAKIEHPKYERRRRLMLVKIIIGILTLHVLNAVFWISLWYFLKSPYPDY